MIYRLTSVAVWPMVRIAFIINAAIGLLFGGMYGVAVFIMGVIMDAVGGSDLPIDTGVMGGIAGIALALFFAVFYGVFGAFFAAVGAWLYNVVARIVGGIELNLETDADPATLPDLSQAGDMPGTLPALPEVVEPPLPEEVESIETKNESDPPAGPPRL